MTVLQTNCTCSEHSDTLISLLSSFSLPLSLSLSLFSFPALSSSEVDEVVDSFGEYEVGAIGLRPTAYQVAITHTVEQAVQTLLLLYLALSTLTLWTISSSEQR